MKTYTPFLIHKRFENRMNEYASCRGSIDIDVLSLLYFAHIVYAHIHPNGEDEDRIKQHMKFFLEVFKQAS